VFISSSNSKFKKLENQEKVISKAEIEQIFEFLFSYFQTESKPAEQINLLIHEIETLKKENKELKEKNEILYRENQAVKNEIVKTENERFIKLIPRPVKVCLSDHDVIIQSLRPPMNNHSFHNLFKYLFSSKSFNI
jgi:hypothetical protein